MHSEARHNELIEMINYDNKKELLKRIKRAKGRIKLYGGSMLMGFMKEYSEEKRRQWLCENRLQKQMYFE